MMNVTHFIIKFTPYGVFGIVAVVVARQAGDTTALLKTANRLGVYMVAVLAGLCIHAIIVLPLILKLVGKINPFTHFQALTTPLLTAFSTSSSSATLPSTLEAVEKKSGVSNKVSSLVLPLGATINMDGTALYECVAAMFIAQAYSIELTFFSTDYCRNNGLTCFYRSCRDPNGWSGNDFSNFDCCWLTIRRSRFDISR